MAVIDPTWARGIDVSVWQGKIDWDAVQASGIAYAFVRVSEAHEAKPHKVIVRRDAYSERNWQELAKRPAMLAGAYCYFRPDQSAKIQAEVFLAALDEYGVGYGSLPTALDIEEHCGFSARRVTDAACEWLDIVHVKTGVRPILYSYSDFLKWHLCTERIAECPLFVADYHNSSPVIPTDWERFDFWQYTEHGSCHGIRSNVDLSIFNGTPAELRGSYFP